MSEPVKTLSPTLAAPKSPLAELLFIAGPTIAQMGSYTLMQFIDTWLLSRMGAGVKEPTAASNSGMLAFSIISLGMGTLFVVNALVSQSFGRRDTASCGRYLWQGLWFALGFFFLLLPTLPFVPVVFRCFGHEPAMVALESVYLQIVVGGSGLKLASTALSQFMLAVNRPNSVLLATVIGIAANALAAWAMIFGHLGSPRLGILGSAWGQNVGVFVELAVMAFLVSRPMVRRTYNLTDWKPRKKMFIELLRIGIPSGVQITAEVLAWSLYTNWVMGVFGTRVMAANTFMFRYMSVSFMPVFGLSTAVTALVGRYLGAGRPDVARQRANLAFIIATTYMILCGMVFFFGRYRLIWFFTQDPQVLKTGATLLVFAAVYQFVDAMYIVYNGGLRGAGDTFVPAVATTTLCWGMTVFGGYAVAKLAPQWGPTGPWSVALAYGVILGIFILLRFRRGKWAETKAADGQRAGTAVVQEHERASRASKQLESA